MSFLKNFHSKISAMIIFAVLLSACGGAAKESNKESKETSLQNPKTGFSEDEVIAEGRDLISENINTVIDILVLYNKEADDSLKGNAISKIYHHIAVTNAIYRVSRIPVELKIVQISQYDINNAMRSVEALSKIRNDENIIAMREFYGADEVLLFRDFANDGMCGVAYQNNYLTKESAYAHITIGCPTYIVAHELGHTMGLVHSEKEPFKGRYNYARGYGEENTFVTIMAYASSFHAKNKIYKFSSPDLECGYSQCGIDKGETGEANAVQALTDAVNTIGNFY